MLKYKLNECDTNPAVTVVLLLLCFKFLFCGNYASSYFSVNAAKVINYV